MITWVVGAGGLLGSAIARRSDTLFTATPVPWSDPEAAAGALRSDAIQFQREAADHPWAVVWAAGSATVATTAAKAKPELAALRALVEAIRDHTPREKGAFFLTSSAGGVYAGSARPPFTTETPPVPLSPYGELKLAQESIALKVLADVCPVVIGRFSNLYGPGQNLDKLQGLISRLALSAVTRQPINIFVPLDTIRDYMYVDDAATQALTATADVIDDGGNTAKTLIIASEQPATIGQLIRTMNQITKSRVPVALGNHQSASGQSLDLRVIPSSEVSAPTPLPAGMKSVYLDILTRVQASTLTA